MPAHCNHKRRALPRSDFVVVAQRLPEFLRAVPAAHYLRARLHRKARVARAVDENFRLYFIDVARRIRAHPRCRDFPPVLFDTEDAGVEQQSEVGFRNALVVQNQVPHFPRELRVARGVFELQLLDDSALAPARPLGGDSQRVHFDFAARIPAEPRSVLNENRLFARARRRQRRRYSRESAARDEHVALQNRRAHQLFARDSPRIVGGLQRREPFGIFVRRQLPRENLRSFDYRRIPDERHSRRREKAAAPHKIFSVSVHRQNIESFPNFYPTNRRGARKIFKKFS